MNFCRLLMMLSIAGSLQIVHAEDTVVGACADIDQATRTELPEGFECVTAPGVTFRLYRRTPEGKEVWQDGKTRKFWTGVIGEMGQPEGYKACRKDADLKSISESGFFHKISFKLASVSNFSEADDDGVFEVIPGAKNSILWTSDEADPSRFPGGYGYVYYGAVVKLGNMRVRADWFQNYDADLHPVVCMANHPLK